MTPIPPRSSNASGHIWAELFRCTPSTQRAIEAAVAAGQVRALGLGLYTSNLVDEPAKILDLHCQHEQEALQDRLMKLSLARALISDATAHTLDEAAALILGPTGHLLTQHRHRVVLLS
jgi:ABC-type cobalamin transport system ATPase subunit